MPLYPGFKLILSCLLSIVIIQYNQPACRRLFKIPYLYNDEIANGKKFSVKILKKY